MKRLGIFLVGLTALLIAAVFWWKVSLTPVNPANRQTQTFIVARGDGVREVSKKLKDTGLIHDQIAFFLLVKKMGIEKNIQAGSFQLSPSLSSYEIANRLTVGTEDVWITIPEGWRSEEIIKYLQEQNIPGPEVGWNEEGKYFPETYLVPKQMTIEEVRNLMRRTFEVKVPETTQDQLIVASLVEREAKRSQDRPLIAGVIYNRLQVGMKLDIDATIQYALGSWKKDLTLEDLQIKSLYNTYTNLGLPPAPICNPGLASIEAAINPAQTDYLYYMHDKNGVAHFAATIEEHNANVAKYLP